MLFKPTTILTLALTSTIVHSNPVKRQDTSSSTNSPIDPALQSIKYTIMALRSASPVHFLPLNAIAGRFYLGGKTTTYCPEEVQWGNFCPPGNQTVFKDSCSLDALNPSYWGVAEQTLWNTDDGVIGYDFSQVRPENTYNCPWYLGTSENTAFAATIEATYGADGFVACPTAQEGVWQVLRSVPDQNKLAAPQGNVSECLGVSLVAIKYDDPEPAAYVYS